MLPALLLAKLAVAVPRGHELSEAYSFELYLRDFADKRYKGEEMEMRRRLFNERRAQVLEHNRRGTSSYVKGINAFTDWTDEEFESILGAKGVHAAKHVETMEETHQPEKLPAAVDWRACSPFADSPLCPLKKRPPVRIVTPVKNQGSCGSCWAFASTATLESHFALSTGRLEELSPQQFVSCAPNTKHCGGTGGCQGSTADVAYGWLSGAGGLASAFRYGYESGVDGVTRNCSAERTQVPLAAVKGFGKPKSNDYNALRNAVATIGPQAVNVYASHWRDYESGVYDGCGYGDQININHVVVLEGYGVDQSSGLGYWLVRNSWATSYGENGYIRLLRERTPRCGVDSKPADGWDCEPFPNNVTVCGQCGIAYQPTYPTGVHVAN